MSSVSVNIVGVGNVLMGDDGVGPEAVARLAAHRLPPGVAVHDAGLAVGDVLCRLDPAEALVLIDAVEGGGPPGTVYRFGWDVLAPAPAEGTGPMSLHDLSVGPALQLEALAGRVFADVTVFGVEPAVVAWGEPLSPAVDAAVGRLVAHVLAHVGADPAPEPAGCVRAAVDPGPGDARP